MDTDLDGKVTKEEFISTLEQKEQNIYNSEEERENAWKEILQKCDLD